MSELENKFILQKYLDDNKEELDKSLLSLRFMKLIDNYLDSQNLSNKEMACKLGFTESYISQLMTGMKNINISFMNKFENHYSVKFEVKLKENFTFNTLLESKSFNIENVNQNTILKTKEPIYISSRNDEAISFNDSRLKIKQEKFTIVEN